MNINTFELRHDERSIIKQVCKKNLPALTVTYEMKEEQGIVINLKGCRVEYYPPAIIRLFALIANFNTHPSNEFVEKDIFLRAS